MRIRVLDMIRQGLLGMNGPTATPASIMQGYLHPSLLAAEVEAVLFGLHGGPTLDYRQQARMLRSNLALPDNGARRARLLTSEITAEELVAMDSRSLAPETLQDKRRAETLEAIKSIVVEKSLDVVDAEEVREQLRDGAFLPSMVPRITVLPDVVLDEPEPNADTSQDIDQPEPDPHAAWLPELPATPQDDATPQGNEARGASVAPENPSLGEGAACDGRAGAPAGAGASPLPDESSCDEDDEQLMDLIHWFSQPVP